VPSEKVLKGYMEFEFSPVSSTASTTWLNDLKEQPYVRDSIKATWLRTMTLDRTTYWNYVTVVITVANSTSRRLRGAVYEAAAGPAEDDPGRLPSTGVRILVSSRSALKVNTTLVVPPTSTLYANTSLNQVVAAVQNATPASIKANLNDNFISYAAQNNVTHDSVAIGAVRVTVTEVLHRTVGPKTVGKVPGGANIIGVKTILASFGFALLCML